MLCNWKYKKIKNKLNYFKNNLFWWMQDLVHFGHNKHWWLVKKRHLWNISNAMVLVQNKQLWPGEINSIPVTSQILCLLADKNNGGQKIKIASLEYFKWCPLWPSQMLCYLPTTNSGCQVASSFSGKFQMWPLATNSGRELRDKNSLSGTSWRLWPLATKKHWQPRDKNRLSETSQVVWALAKTNNGILVKQIASLGHQNVVAFSHN